MTAAEIQLMVGESEEWLAEEQMEDASTGSQACCLQGRRLSRGTLPTVTMDEADPHRQHSWAKHLGTLKGQQLFLRHRGLFA